MAVNEKIPKSRLMIQYDTRVDGQKIKKELPFKVLLMGDFSGGVSDDAKLPLEQRQVREMPRGVDHLLGSMGISIPIKVENVVNPSSEGPMLELNYKLDKVKDFSPDNVAKAIPGTRRLLELRKILVSFDKEMDNNLRMRKMVNSILSSPQQRDELMQKLTMVSAYQVSLASREDQSEVTDA